MATAAKPRRRRKAPSLPKAGKETWEIVDPAGLVVGTRDGSYTEGAIINLATRIAERNYEDATQLDIRLRPLFGPLDTFFEIVRCEDGTILIHRTR